MVGWCATDASRACCALGSQSGVDRIFAVATIRSEEHRKSAIRSPGTLKSGELHPDLGTSGHRRGENGGGDHLSPCRPICDSGASVQGG